MKLLWLKLLGKFNVWLRKMTDRINVYIKNSVKMSSSEIYNLVSKDRLNLLEMRKDISDYHKKFYIFLSDTIYKDNLYINKMNYKTSKIMIDILVDDLLKNDAFSDESIILYSDFINLIMSKGK